MKISLIKTLNSGSPKVEPWGTPLLISFHKVNVEPIFTLYLREVK